MAGINTITAKTATAVSPLRDHDVKKSRGALCIAHLLTTSILQDLHGRYTWNRHHTTIKIRAGSVGRKNTLSQRRLSQNCRNIGRPSVGAVYEGAQKMLPAYARLFFRLRGDRR